MVSVLVLRALRDGSWEQGVAATLSGLDSRAELMRWLGAQAPAQGVPKSNAMRLLCELLYTLKREAAGAVRVAT